MCYKEKIVEVFETRNLIRRAKKGKTFEAGLIRGQGTKGLCTKRASKKRKPAKSFPL
jgi:hypothetical protein